MASQEVQENKPLDLSTGDELLHKKSDTYLVLDLDVRNTETMVVDSVTYPPGTHCILYKSYVTGIKWVRPLAMLTEDRFKIIGNIYSIHG